MHFFVTEGGWKLQGWLINWELYSDVCGVDAKIRIAFKWQEGWDNLWYPLQELTHRLEAGQEIPCHHKQVIAQSVNINTKAVPTLNLRVQSIVQAFVIESATKYQEWFIGTIETFGGYWGWKTWWQDKGKDLGDCYGV